ncbi:MAG: type II toxin-antitoxin system RelE/ParE family toxin [Nitrospinae bacterium]|nr:type II toxin-antitoxin system RelE/ParE family toxin [Nitrospinota bacterium]MBI5748518.1 type II toxin-antitoxin system RelE/ParE family toxin [Nitrospinota bacterium]
MKFTVHLIEDAEKDLLDVYQYVALNDSAEEADKLINHIEETIQKLETFPLRGHIPPELERIGVLEFREVHYKPFRIIYEIHKSEVFIHCILDGRRDLQELLQKRVLR